MAGKETSSQGAIWGNHCSLYQGIKNPWQGGKGFAPRFCVLGENYKVEFSEKKLHCRNVVEVFEER